MNRLGKLFAIAALNIVALVCTYGSARPQANIKPATFAPPSGWQLTESARRLPRGFLMAGIWSSSASPGETISFGYGAVPAELRNDAALASYDVVKVGAKINELATRLGTTVVSSGAVRLCDGKVQGWETVTAGKLLGVALTSETVVTLSPSLFASAIYTRPTASRPNAAAEQALRTLCT